VNERELTEYNERWLKECLKDENLFDHERALLRVMIGALPMGLEPKELNGAPKHISHPIPYVTELFEQNTKNRGDAQQSEPGGDYVLTGKKKKLTGTDLEKFWLFWNAFDYKKSRAEAAQAWMDIPDTKDEAFMEHILYAARQTASERKPAVTPKMAQGWLSARRWEDYEASSAQSPTEWSIEKWKEFLDGPSGSYMHKSKSWPDYLSGPNPWEYINRDIPQEVLNIYGKAWGWLR